VSLWTEIKQRRMTQIVIGYLAGGWIVLTVFNDVVDREVLAPVFYEVAFTLYLFGIGAALIIGWYHGEKGEQKAQPLEIFMLTILGVGALGTSGLVIRNAMAEAEIAGLVGDNLRDIAVLYLDDASRDGSIQATADGITEGLISSLRQVSELNVSSRNASREVRGLDVSTDSIASILEVGALIDGSVDQAGDELRVTVRMREASSATILFRETYTWPASEVATVGTDLAEQVAEEIREVLGIEIRMREAQAAAPNSAAWLNVARAESYLSDAASAAAAGDSAGVMAAFEAAESELDQAIENTPDDAAPWPEPYVLRSQVEYEQWILAGTLEQLAATMEESIDWANRALEMEPDNAGALEWRGTAAYRQWLSGAVEEDQRDDLFRQASSDLRRARTLDRTRASVLSTLSHLYQQTNDPTASILAAREAYQQDAFLSAADGVLWRLYTGSYDTGEFSGAEQACQEGSERFPDDFRFVQCQLFLMTMPTADPAVRTAWELHEEMVSLLTTRPEFFAAQGRLVVGGVIGRAGLADSAQAVFASTNVDPQLDPDRELLVIEAAMRSVSGDVDGAIAALERYLVANSRAAVDQHWWWDPLRGDPAFQRLQSR
jgi:TolB-like protein